MSVSIAWLIFGGILLGVFLLGWLGICEKQDPDDATADGINYGKREE